MLHRRQFLKAAAAAVAAPRIAQAADGRVLRFVPQADLAVLDPIWTTATVTRNHAFLIFDTLYGQDKPFKAVPQMAEGAVTEDDGKRWKITLREGLIFHDGERVLARDCVASLKRWGKRDAFGQTLMAAADELSAVDDRTIQFRQKKPFPLLLDALGKCTAFVPVIMPERLAATDAFTPLTEMVGSGPFRFVAAERMAGARVVYERFDRYRPRQNGVPEWTSGPKVVNFDRIEWTIIPDAATAGAALQSGEVDFWEFPTPDLQPLLRRNRAIEVAIKDPTGNIGLVRMNHLLPPFDNPAIRRAILGAVSQEDNMIAVAGTDPSMWRTGVGIFPPGTPLSSNVDMECLDGPRDFARVKRDLQAAGYKGEKIVLLCVSDLPILKAESDVGTDMFVKAGMNVDAQVMDWGTVVNRRAKKDSPEHGGWNVFFSGWSGLDMFNPAGHLSLRGNGAGAWFGWPTSPKLEQLRDAWFEAPDLATQQKIAAEMQRQAFIDVPYIPLGQYFQPVAYRKSVAGVLTGFPVFWNLRRV
jgi:peptide/nickel transport system substrate-binding protein